MLRPPGATDVTDHISPTSAKSYLGCSLKYFFEKVMRLKKPVPVALHCGKAVHAGLQAFHLARWRGQDDSPEAVAAAFEESFVALERDEGPVNYPDAASREKARQDGLRVLAAYLDSPEVLREKPRGVEVLLSENIDGLHVRLTGAVDLVRGDLTPVDFKSAASRPDPEQAAFDHELQLVCVPTPVGSRHRRKAAGARPGVFGQDEGAASGAGECQARRPASQGTGQGDAAHRRRRHHRPAVPPAARNALRLVPVPPRVRGVDGR